MIESIICYNLALWWSTISYADKIDIYRIFKVAAKITKTDVLSIDYMYVKCVLKKDRRVVFMESDPLHQ